MASISTLHLKTLTLINPYIFIRFLNLISNPIFQLLAVILVCKSNPQNNRNYPHLHSRNLLSSFHVTYLLGKLMDNSIYSWRFLGYGDKISAPCVSSRSPKFLLSEWKQSASILLFFYFFFNSWSFLGEMLPRLPHWFTFAQPIYISFRQI